MEVREARGAYYSLPVAEVDAAQAGYRQTEAGVVPKEWEVCALNTVVRSHNSGVYKSQALYGSGCNIAGVSDIYRVDKIDGQRFSLVPLSTQEQAKYMLRHNDLLYGESSLVREGIARTVYVSEQGEGTAFAWHTRRYSIDQKVLLSPYLYYFLQSRAARAHMISNSIQTAITGINTVSYFSCPVIIPSRAEQEAIAEALSDADALIESLEQLIAKKRQIKQGTMQALLTGKQRLPGFGGKLESKRLDQLGRWVGGMTPSMRNPSYWQGGTVPWISSGDVKLPRLKDTTQRVTAAALKDHTTTLVPENSIVVVMRSGILRKFFPVAMNMVPMAINQDLKALIPESGMCAEYILHALIGSGDEILARCLKSGTTVESVEFGWLKSFTIWVPAPEEQAAIATILSDMDTELAELEARLAKTRQLKQGMMQELLTGRIRLV